MDDHWCLFLIPGNSFGLKEVNEIRIADQEFLTQPEGRNLAVPDPLPYRLLFDAEEFGNILGCEVGSGVTHLFPLRVF